MYVSPDNRVKTIFFIESFTSFLHFNKSHKSFCLVFINLQYRLLYQRHITVQNKRKIFTVRMTNDEVEGYKKKMREERLM